MADRSRGPRQRKHWHSLGTLARANFTTDATAILGSFVSSDGDPFTVLRMIGQGLVSPTGSGTFVASDTAIVTVALGIVSADAIALGLTAMPDPDSEPEYPWLYWHTTFTNFEGSADAPGQELAMTDRFTIESRAMRKVGPRQGLVAVAQYVDASGTPPLSVDLQVRFLIGE